RQRIAQFSSAPSVVAQIACEGIFSLNGTPLKAVKGKRVALFCGIGNPIRFVQTVEKLGAHVLATQFSSDHKLPNKKILHRFARQAQEKGCELLLCTEKDKVKLIEVDKEFELLLELPMPVGWMKANLEIVENQEAWEKLTFEMKMLTVVET